MDYNIVNNLLQKSKIIKGIRDDENAKKWILEYR